MEIKKAEKLAIDLMKKHRLTYDGLWMFKFDNAKRRFGYCHHGLRTISLSKSLTKLNPEKIVKNTILHEIAHALVGRGHGHNKVWRAKAREIGCNGNRCYGSEVQQPKGKFNYKCPNCKNIINRIRRYKNNVACYQCCKKFNNNKWSAKFILELI